LRRNNQAFYGGSKMNNKKPSTSDQKVNRDKYGKEYDRIFEGTIDELEIDIRNNKMYKKGEAE